MEGCCDICGNIGVEEALVTCSRCNSSCEHKYCRRSQVDIDSVDWCCEECEPASKPIPQAVSGLTKITPESSKPINSVKFSNVVSWGRRGAKKGSGASVNWEKKVASGKTKYISANEAIFLSSGAKKSSLPFKIASHSLPPRPRNGLNKLDRIPLKSRIPAQPNIASGSVQRLGSPPQAARAPLMQEKTVEVNLARTKGKTVMMKPPLASAPSVSISGSKVCTNLEVSTRNDENVNVNIIPDSEKRIPNSSTLWKGSLNIRDSIMHGKRYPKIQAHPPCIVRRKVYDFSKKMPGLLSFELVPCVKVLPPKYLPDRKDIGLYFFPSNFEIAEDYISLVEYLCSKNMALKLQIADVKLLVFASQLLPKDCRYWGGRKYLWGIFRRLDSIRSSLPVTGMEEEVDMDIDMIGGVTVGSRDVAVRREISATP